MDCNPAQSALLELKQVAIRQLDYEDVWALFGEGKVRVCGEGKVGALLCCAAPAVQHWLVSVA